MKDPSTRYAVHTNSSKTDTIETHGEVSKTTGETEGTQDGTMFKIKGKGIKKLRTKNDFGDLYVKVVVEVPKSLTKEQKELLRQLDGTMDNKSTPKRKKFFDTLKDFFD